MPSPVIVQSYAYTASATGTSFVPQLLSNPTPGNVVICFIITNQASGETITFPGNINPDKWFTVPCINNINTVSYGHNVVNGDTALLPAIGNFNSIKPTVITYEINGSIAYPYPTAPSVINTSTTTSATGIFEAQWAVPASAYNPGGLLLTVAVPSTPVYSSIIPVTGSANFTVDYIGTGSTPYFAGHCFPANSGNNQNFNASFNVTPTYSGSANINCGYIYIENNYRPSPQIVQYNTITPGSTTTLNSTLANAPASGNFIVCCIADPISKYDTNLITPGSSWTLNKYSAANSTTYSAQTWIYSTSAANFNGLDSLQLGTSSSALNPTITTYEVSNILQSNQTFGGNTGAIIGSSSESFTVESFGFLPNSLKIGVSCCTAGSGSYVLPSNYSNNSYSTLNYYSTGSANPVVFYSTPNFGVFGQTSYGANNYFNSVSSHTYGISQAYLELQSELLVNPLLNEAAQTLQLSPQVIQYSPVASGTVSSGSPWGATGLPLPVAPTPGNQLVAFFTLSVAGTGTTIHVPSGWSGGFEYIAGSSERTIVFPFFKTATSSDTGVIAVTGSAITGVSYATQVVEISNCNVSFNLAPSSGSTLVSSSPASSGTYTFPNPNGVVANYTPFLPIYMYSDVIPATINFGETSYLSSASIAITGSPNLYANFAIGNSHVGTGFYYRPTISYSTYSTASLSLNTLIGYEVPVADTASLSITPPSYKLSGSVYTRVALYNSLAAQVSTSAKLNNSLSGQIVTSAKSTNTLAGSSIVTATTGKSLSAYITTSYPATQSISANLYTVIPLIQSLTGSLTVITNNNQHLIGSATISQTENHSVSGSAVISQIIRQNIAASAVTSKNVTKTISASGSISAKENYTLSGQLATRTVAIDSLHASGSISAKIYKTLSGAISTSVTGGKHLSAQFRTGYPASGSLAASAWTGYYSYHHASGSAIISAKISSLLNASLVTSAIKGKHLAGVALVGVIVTQSINAAAIVGIPTGKSISAAVRTAYPQFNSLPSFVTVTTNSQITINATVSIFVQPAGIPVFPPESTSFGEDNPAYVKTVLDYKPDLATPTKPVVTQPSSLPAPVTVTPNGQNAQDLVISALAAYHDTNATQIWLNTAQQQLENALAGLVVPNPNATLGKLQQINFQDLQYALKNPNDSTSSSIITTWNNYQYGVNGRLDALFYSDIYRYNNIFQPVLLTSSQNLLSTLNFVLNNNQTIDPWTNVNNLATNLLTSELEQNVTQPYNQLATTIAAMNSNNTYIIGDIQQTVNANALIGAQATTMVSEIGKNSLCVGLENIINDLKALSTLLSLYADGGWLAFLGNLQNIEQMILNQLIFQLLSQANGMLSHLIGQIVAPLTDIALKFDTCSGGTSYSLNVLGNTLALLASTAVEKFESKLLETYRFNQLHNNTTGQNVKNGSNMNSIRNLVNTLNIMINLLSQAFTSTPNWDQIANDTGQLMGNSVGSQGQIANPPNLATQNPPPNATPASVVNSGKTYGVINSGSPQDTANTLVNQIQNQLSPTSSSSII